ncbi:patatin-like phospholipase family protein [Carboxylicivirga linearis]|uniref:Patatin-like phospholipase family protein n=1 Tax=Carboxylicivirga linearis TaxID=1628157 RepID=A0ABS5K1S8_9BACT|nr:patatin-like phospholipase family protein [Carboxylicivirga linearis]MBS2100621.1 patatin-like phospholipase family protein [Carboxylicivirga linearis]
MYKILSLDGGGSWAILQLLTLRDRYGDATGHEILRDFDMVVANSGGSIVLAALAENWTLEEALGLFKDKYTRESIFSANKFKNRFFPVDYLRLLGIPFGPKYSSKQKLIAFRSLFKEVDKRQMEDLPAFIGKESLKLVVATYDALNNRAKFFKSYPSQADDFDSVRLTQAIHGSSNAPVQYFDFPARFKAQKSEVFYDLWDGALGGFNNPILAGVIEAFKAGVELDKIQIVSLGTGNKLMSEKAKEQFWNDKQAAIMNRRKKWAVWKWGPQVKFFGDTVLNQAKTILYQPPDWANYVTMMFLKATNGDDFEKRIVRLSPLIHFNSDLSDKMKELVNVLYELDMDLTKDQQINELINCFEEWKAGELLNQPLAFKVKRNNDVIYLNGDKNYREAMQRWKEM